MKAIVGLMLMGFGLLAGGNAFYQHVHFGNECGMRLKRAADSNTIELATTELEAAVTYAEKEKLTEGFTSVLYRTADEDVGFWYKNLRASLDELKKEAARENATPMEKTNLLMKLRETLLDHHDKGESVTIPDGIERFPNNTGWAVVNTLAGILAIIGFLCFLVFLGEKDLLK